MESGRRGSLTPFYCSRVSGRRVQVVPLLFGYTGILNAMESFMQVFP